MTVTLTADTPSEVDAWAMKWLAQRGYQVSTPGDWMPLGGFLKEVGLSPQGFWRIRHRKGCPDFESREGPTGRLIDIKATPELRRFCRAHKEGKK